MLGLLHLLGACMCARKYFCFVCIYKYECSDGMLLPGAYASVHARMPACAPAVSKTRRKLWYSPQSPNHAAKDSAKACLWHNTCFCCTDRTSGHAQLPPVTRALQKTCVCVCVCVMLASSAAQERARLHAQWARAVHHLERARLAERIAPPAEQPSPGTRPCPAEGCEAGTVRAAGSLLAGRAACGHWSTCQVCSPGAR